jgi:hypothetical protein
MRARGARSRGRTSRYRPPCHWGSACEAASCTSRGGTPASSAAVMNACLRVCSPTGLVMPAWRAILRTIRQAPYRPAAHRPWSGRIGPSQRSPMARSIARAVRGASGIVTFFPPFAHDRQGPVAAFDTQGLDVGAGGRGDPQPVQGQQREQRMLGCRPEPGGHQQRADLVAVQPDGMGLIVHAGPSRQVTMQGLTATAQASGNAPDRRLSAPPHPSAQTSGRHRSVVR